MLTGVAFSGFGMVLVGATSLFAVLRVLGGAYDLFSSICMRALHLALRSIHDGMGRVSDTGRLRSTNFMTYQHV